MPGAAHATPRVGDSADHHSGDLDPRPVAEVSEDGRMVKLDIMGRLTPWVPASNYAFRAPK